MEVRLQGSRRPGRVAGSLHEIWAGRRVLGPRHENAGTFSEAVLVSLGGRTGVKSFCVVSGLVRQLLCFPLNLLNHFFREIPQRHAAWDAVNCQRASLPSINARTVAVMFGAV